VQSEVRLKASSNLHTVAWPYLVGAVAGREATDPKARYRTYQRDLFARAGLDREPAGSADGLYRTLIVLSNYDTTIAPIVNLARRLITGAAS
jgi:hypothetical protein